MKSNRGSVKSEKRHFSGIRFVKFFQPILLLILCFCGATFAQHEDGGEMFLIGLGETVGTIRDHFDYFVKWSDIPCRAEWNPELNAFPIELGKEATRARSFLLDAKQITNGLTLNRVSISCFPLTKSAAEAHGKKTEDFDNQWLIAFAYWIKPIPNVIETKHTYFAVMLLDGTYAKEKPESLFDEANTISNKEFFKASLKDYPDVKTIEQSSTQTNIARDQFNAYQKLRQANFEVPKVKWNAFSDSFPMNLRTQIALARNYLPKEHLDTSIKPELCEISIEHYIPLEAIQAQGLDPFSNMETNWIVVFRYRQKSDGGTSFYNVYMLLDGTIL